MSLVRFCRVCYVTLRPNSAALDDTVQVSAVVTNTGSRTADEVVQLYACDPMPTIRSTMNHVTIEEQTDA